MEYRAARTHYQYLVIVAILLILLIITALFCPNFNSKSDSVDKTFALYQIGEITRENGHTFININKAYLPGLKGLENFPELTVVYWFDQNDSQEQRSILQVHPKGDPENPNRGVFATHAPVRPNLIAISRVKIISINENIIEIDEIDAYDHSPVIDLKN